MERILIRSAEAPAQKSPEWIALRKGVITATDVAAITGISRFDTPDDILYKKLGVERKFNERSRVAMAHGVKYEDEARDIYAAARNERVHEVGFYIHETYPFIGASPDGITESGRLIEIKCPTGDLRTSVPDYYMTQIQTCLEVLDLEECDYIEYKPGLPQMVIRVARDRDWFARTLPVLRSFWDRVTERKSLPLCEIHDEDEADDADDDPPYWAFVAEIEPEEP